VQVKAQNEQSVRNALVETVRLGDLMKGEHEVNSCVCNVCKSKMKEGHKELAFYTLFAIPLGFAFIVDPKMSNVAMFAVLTLMNSYLLFTLCLRVNVANALKKIK